MCTAGFIAYAGNWEGQGLNYNQLFSGASLFDNSVYTASAPAYESWPSTYMSSASPSYFGTSEVIIQTSGATGAKDAWPAVGGVHGRHRARHAA